jgi:hypothetical protein
MGNSVIIMNGDLQKYMKVVVACCIAFQYSVEGTYDLTDHHLIVVETPASCSRGLQFESLPGDWLCREIFDGFFQSVQKIAECTFNISQDYSHILLNSLRKHIEYTNNRTLFL